MTEKKVKELYKFEPKTTDDFEGHILVDVPKHSAKVRLYKKCAFDIDSDGKIVEVDEYERYARMVETFCNDLVKEVSLKNKITGMEYLNADDLENDASCDTLLQNLARIALEGVKLGNVKESP